MELSSAVSVRDLSVYFEEGGRPVIDGIDIEIVAGEHVGLIGRSGCGKSTLANVLCGLVPDRYHGFVKGEVRVCGLEQPRDRKALSRRMGIVFQDPEEMFVSEMTIDEVSFSLGCRGIEWEEAQAKVHKAASALGFKDLLERRTSDLSGGEKQVLALASQVVTDPDVLILDEPTSQLDPLGRTRFRKVLRRLRSIKPELSVLHIEQDLEMLSDADRIMGLKDGRIALQGPPEKVLLDREALARVGLGPPWIYDVVSTTVEMGLIKGPLSDLKGLPRPLWSVLGEVGPELPPREVRGNKPAGAIGLDAVSFRHPGAPGGLKGVDLDLTGVRSVALVGRNGAGKTTLGKIVSGLLGPDSGSRWGDGKCFYLFQRPSSMFFSSSVRTEVKGTMGSKGLLTALDLDSVLDRAPSLLSEGEKQRLGIVLALGSGADLVVLDEPFRALDMPMVSKVWKLLGRKGSPAHMIITNDLGTAAQCAEVIVLSRGRVIARGDPDHILCDPKVLRRLGWAIPPACPISIRAGMGRTCDMERIGKALKGVVG